MEVITRKQYAEKVDSWLGKEDIIVIVGQRRVGKSYILKDFIKRHSSETDANIIYVDKEKRKFGFLKTGEELGVYLEERWDANLHNYILVDHQGQLSQVRHFAFALVGIPRL